MITIRPTPATPSHPLTAIVPRPGQALSADPAERRTPRRRVDPNPTRSAVFSRAPGRVYRHRRASLRRVWLEPRPCPHAGLLSVFADDRDRLARGLAPHLRR